MKKSMLTPAIIVISMMIFPTNANAQFWLDIVRAAAKGIVNVVSDASKKTPDFKMQVSNQPTAQANATAVEPTEQQLMAAFDSLARHCKEFSRQGLPCGMHTAKSTLSPGNALEIANTRADGELSRAVKQFIDTKVKDELKQTEDDEGNSSESMEYKRTLEVTANNELSGAQTYITYSRVTKNDKGKEVYNVWVVRVLDVNIFERALAESSQGRTIGQFIGEMAKGFASKVKNSMKKKN
ncbi:MAG: hypothetical protein LBC64_04615 [Fibromonadaceae bacterium]|jgi:hypothetical protein|nr:hypothetical protein [Fibromonadaceae bacterium]